MLKTQLHHSLNQTIEEYGNGTVLDWDWDRVQNAVSPTSCRSSSEALVNSSTSCAQFACCGVNNYTDWNRSHWHANHSNLTFPDSCCKSLKSCDNNSVGQIYTDGCYPTILSVLTDNFTSIGLVTFFISLFQVSFFCQSGCFKCDIYDDFFVLIAALRRNTGNLFRKSYQQSTLRRDLLSCLIFSFQSINLSNINHKDCNPHHM